MRANEKRCAADARVLRPFRAFGTAGLTCEDIIMADVATATADAATEDQDAASVQVRLLRPLLAAGSCVF